LRLTHTSLKSNCSARSKTDVGHVVVVGRSLRKVVLVNKLLWVCVLSLSFTDCVISQNSVMHGQIRI